MAHNTLLALRRASTTLRLPLPLALTAALTLLTSSRLAAQSAPPPAAAPPALQPAAPTPPHAATATAATPPPSPGPAPLASLSPAAQQALAQIVADPAPPELVRNTHYVVSNEDRLDLFRRVTENRGGAYIGVGTDQNYLLAAWAKPQILVLFDFDQIVVNVHHVYRAFFLAAKTPAELRSLWDPRNEAPALAAINAAYTDEKRRAECVRAYRMARHAVTARFNKILQVFQIHKIPWFLTDQAQYDTVVALFRADRVVMVRGDLTAGGAMTSIANALTASGVKVGLLYMSNAERYFTYTPSFRKSMLALPMDDKAIVLRTRARIDGVYEYISQDAAVFRGWLERSKITLASQMSRLREPDPQTPGAWVIRKLPESAP